MIKLMKFSEADFSFSAVPETNETKKLISKKRLDTLKSTWSC